MSVETTYTVKIVVATHKKYTMASDPMYLPLHVGAEGKTDADGNELDFGYVKDNTGDNISAWNPSFCELTGLYWAWKNLKEDYIGLVHYRRYFCLHKTNDPFDGVLKYSELALMLEDTSVFVPKKRKYYIETLYSHYAHTHYADHLDQTREIIREKYPMYLPSYDKVVRQRSGYMFNMMILRRELLDQYCAWLFDILFALRERIDAPEMSAFQARFYGRISEIIFNVWLDYQLETGAIKRSALRELPYIYMEKINWWKKGTAFLRAKLFGTKYEGSF